MIRMRQTLCRFGSVTVSDRKLNKTRGVTGPGALGGLTPISVLRWPTAPLVIASSTPFSTRRGRKGRCSFLWTAFRLVGKEIGRSTFSATPTRRFRGRTIPQPASRAIDPRRRNRPSAVVSVRPWRHPRACGRQHQNTNTLKATLQEIKS